MSATFVTDLCTAIALSAIFIKPNAWFPVFLVVSFALIFVLPRIAPWFFGRYGDRVIEPEIKLVFACLLVLMVLADLANGHAVLPAFVLGLVMSSHYAEHREEQKRLRVVAFAFLTPFFFIKGGLNVSLAAVFSNLGLLAVLLAAKMVPKLAFVYPLARRADPRHGIFSTLLMSTGLTFGTISSLYGLNAGIIDRDAVLPPRHRRRPLGGRPDGDRRALVPSRRGTRARSRPASRLRRVRGVRVTRGVAASARWG